VPAVFSCCCCSLCCCRALYCSSLRFMRTSSTEVEIR
jgi:hypothetical protein